MSTSNVKRYLLPLDEADPGFREEMNRLSVIGLRAIGVVCLTLPLMLHTGRVLLVDDTLSVYEFQRVLLLVAMGILLVPLSFLPQVHSYARAVGIAVAVLGAIILIVSAVALSPILHVEYHHIPGNMTIVMLVAVAALPLKPAQTFLLGTAVSATLLAVMLGEARSPLQGDAAGWDAMHVVTVMSITLICAGLTAVIYAERSSSYWVRQQALRSFEDLRKAQARLLITENSASQGRLAAALSHELNSPIGAINSTIQTLLSILQRQRGQPLEAARLDQVVDNIAQTARESVERLTELVSRMQRFTNLDRAEDQVIDLNELLTDTAYLLHSELNAKAEVSMDLKPLPPVKGRPQELSAVFSNLLRNAAHAMEQKGNIWVSSHPSDGQLVVEVRDNGRGIPAHRLSYVFEPTLVVNQGRISAANWNLFNARNILLEHGGQIDIESAEGKGTTVVVSLPACPTCPPPR